MTSHNQCSNCGQTLKPAPVDYQNTLNITCDDCLFFTGTYIVTTPNEQLLIQTVSDGTVRVARRADQHDSWQPPMWGKQIPHE
jgi:hypothetical protein